MAGRGAHVDSGVPSAARHQRPLGPSGTQDPDPFPTNVDVDRTQQVMEITWEDGSKSTYTADQLRWACPCAECRGEAGMPGRLSRVKTLSDSELRIRDVTLVGQYALQIAFESGHASGIYSFSLLKHLMP
ncbi:MAG TPA: DUF971 domain-containing protein [Candidatus Dormibacteraeota bacterium]|nr:DUF971 domain-containing protein [Candidatus Dormibacteraeota bacterium]